MNASLELLSSLASRRGSGFETAKSMFSEAIDHLTLSDDIGASALELAIAASPDIALRMIRGLFLNPSERWKATGVRLLRDIGTDDALDRLVRLFGDSDADSYGKRAQAGLVLSGMITIRNRALRDRANLLAEKKDRDLWPLERFFPGTIAISIAEAIGPKGSGFLAIDCVSKALDERMCGGYSSNTSTVETSSARLCR